MRVFFCPIIGGYRKTGSVTVAKQAFTSWYVITYYFDAFLQRARKLDVITIINSMGNRQLKKQHSGIIN
jgi:hypothetical protein